MERSMDYSNTDKYTASIEFSNACREFYIKRVKAAENLKHQIKTDSTVKSEVLNTQRPKSSMESSMDKLRREMASLMDQDLSLMKQLLTLNETIEDIKTRRLYGVSKESLCQSDEDLCESRESFSDMDLYDSDGESSKDSDLKYTHLTVKDDYKHPTDHKIVQRIGSVHRKQNSCKDSHTVRDITKPQIIHGAQSSIDSGYDESDCYQTDIEVTI